MLSAEPSPTVVDLVEERVDADGSAPAVVGSDVAFTYGQLDETANRIAHALQRLDPDRRHPYGGVLVAPGAWPVAALLGVVKSGRTAVGLDVTAPTERQLEVEEQLGSLVVVVDRRHREQLHPGTPVVVLEDLPGDLPADRPAVPIDLDDGFSVHFTSGSTGRPKGALRTQRAQARAVRNHPTNRYRPGLRVALLHDVAFAASRATIWDGLVNGVELHVLDARAHGPTGLAAWLVAHRIEVLPAPASLIEAMVAYDPPQQVLGDLERVSFSGDVLRIDTLRRLAPFVRPATEFRNTYGSSEMGLVSSYAVVAGALPDGDLMPAGPVSDRVTLRIVDPDDQGVGEIEVSGPTVAVRYVDDTTDDRRSYRDDEGRRWFRSGDLGHLRPDGLLEVRGRLDDRVKVRGQTLDPAEVELALLARPDVVDVHVGLRGAGGTEPLVAWLEPVPGLAPTVTAIRRDLRSRLPGWMIPQRVVLMETLPRTDRGKVDRAALPRPGSRRPELDVAYEAPRTPLELRLAEAFGTVLDIEAVGRHDPFFDLGGDSLAAAELVDHVGRALGRDLPVDPFVEGATPAALALRLQAEPQGPEDRLLRLQTSGEGTPVVLVHAGHGFVITYGHLAEAMAGHRPVLGLQMLPDDRAHDLRSLPRLARRYADLLDRQLPGPVMVAGYSGGSLLAHALAAELTGRGREVPAVVLLDPVAATEPRRQAKALAYRLLARVPLRLRPDRVTQQRMAVMAAGTRVHRPTPIAVPIVVARADLARPERWVPLTTAGVRVVDVPGDHRSMLYPPHATALGERLEPRLQELDRHPQGRRAPTA